MADLTQRHFNLALNSLKTIGYFKSRFWRILFGSLFFISNIIILIGGIIGFINRAVISEQTEIIYNCNVQIFLIFLYVIIVNHHKLLQQFLLNIFQNQSVVDNIRMEVIQLTINIATNLIPKWIVIMLCFCITVMTFWCITPFLNEFDYHNKNFYVIPYLFQCSENVSMNWLNVNFPCTNRETRFDFLFTNFLISLYFLWVASIACWLLLFVLILTTFVGANISVIKKTLSQWEENSENCIPARILNENMPKDENTRNNHRAKIQLIKVIIYHQYLFR